MGFRAQLDPARKVLEAIEKDGQRGEDGELLRPYSTWAIMCREAIRKAESYLEAVEGQKGG